MRIVGLLVISIVSVIASFAAVWVAIQAMPSDATWLAPMMIVPTFTVSAVRFFSLNAIAITAISVAMLVAWLVGAVFFIPEHAFAVTLDKTSYDYCKYEFRAHFTSISAGLVFLLILDRNIGSRDSKTLNRSGEASRS